MKFYRMSWEELEKNCLALYKKIRKQKYDRILCISRGGLVWARMFSDLFDNLPISHLTAVSYTGIHSRKDVKITELPNHESIKNQRLLVIDEIADQGKTFTAIAKALKTMGVHDFTTMAPIIRSFTNPKPDIYLKVIDDWVIFPYEIKETYKALFHTFKDVKKIKSNLNKYGFSKYGNLLK